MPRPDNETNQTVCEAMDKCWCELSWHIGSGRTKPIFSCHKCFKKIQPISGWELYEKDIPLFTAYEEHHPNYLKHGSDWTEMINWAKEEEWWDSCLWVYRAKRLDADCLDSPQKAMVALFANESALAEHIADYLTKEKDDG